MSAPAEPDLIKVTEVFLIPSSFLVAALGTADTNLHRAGVSVIGLVVSVMWWACSREAFADRYRLGPDDLTPARPSRRVRIMNWLPALFVAGWALSSGVHFYLWGQPMGH